MPSLVHSLHLTAWLSSVLAFSPLTLHTRSLLSPTVSNDKGPLLFSSIADGDIPSDVNEEDEETSSSSTVATASPPLTSDTIEGARANVLSTATSLLDSSLTGIFLTTPKGINELDLACRQLEAIAPEFESADSILGDWDLVCTARAPKLPVQLLEGSGGSTDKNTVWDLLPKPPKVQDTINKSLSVLQRIRTSSDDEEDSSTEITRIDHVLEYTPLTLSQLIPPTSPLSSLRTWNVNPLQVSTSKITLIHKAQVESIAPVLRTQLALQSVVVNVAGTSQYLDPEGADVLGVNLPSLGEWSNSGSFDTTFCDGSVRISRGKTLGLEELRVFVKRGSEDALALGIGVTVEETPEEEETEEGGSTSPSMQEERVQNFKEAVQDVKMAVEKLDSDVKGKVQDAAKGVQEVVQEDLKEISDKVNKVKNVVIGKEEEPVAKVEEEEDEAVVEPVEAVAEEVDEVVEEEEEKEEDADDEVESDSSANEI